MADILNITGSQARVLRAIAYYEANSGKKGATQYQCYKKVPTGFHVSNSTFSENIKDLEKKLLVMHYEDSDSERDTIPYTITDIGQVAWLRQCVLSENIEIIKKVFPNINLSAIDNIIVKIDHPGSKHLQDNYSIGILQTTLENFHVLEEEDSIPSVARSMKEIIGLSAYGGLMKTSFIRYYKIGNPTNIKKLTKNELSRYNENLLEELKIGVMDRITFLFYYNLVESIIDKSYKMKLIKTIPIEQDFRKMTNNQKSKTYDLIKEESIKMIKDLGGFHKMIINKKNEFLKIITSNDIVSKIMVDNLKDLNQYKDTSFQDITNMFMKI